MLEGAPRRCVPTALLAVRRARPRKRWVGAPARWPHRVPVSSRSILSSGCTETFTEQFVKAGGRMTGEHPASGRAMVGKKASVRSAGNYSGIGVTSLGRLSGRSGSCTFQRSDGCSGRWVVIQTVTAHDTPARSS